MEVTLRPGNRWSVRESEGSSESYNIGPLTGQLTEREKARDRNSIDDNKREYDKGTKEIQ